MGKAEQEAHPAEENVRRPQKGAPAAHDESGGNHKVDQGHTAVWQWMHDIGWRNYPAFFNNQIEEEFGTGATMMTLSHPKYEGRTVEVNFETMQQHDKTTGI